MQNLFNNRMQALMNPNARQLHHGLPGFATTIGGVPPPLLMPGFAATGPPQPQPMPTSVFANEQGQLAQRIRIQASANQQAAVTAANGEPVAEGMTYISGRKIVNNVVTKIATPYSTGHIPCPYGCGRSFKHATQKAIHIRKVHTGDRPFVCKVEDCKKSFYSSGDLKSHEKTHTGLKPFECPSCGKALSSRNALKVHTKALHTLDRPFKCEVPNCGMTYMTRLDLDRHVKKHNKWEQKEEKAKIQSLEKRTEKAEKKVKQLELKLDKKEVREQKKASSSVSAGKLVQCQPGDVVPEGAVAYFVPSLNGSNAGLDKLEVVFKRKGRRPSSAPKSPGGSAAGGGFLGGSAEDGGLDDEEEEDGDEDGDEDGGDGDDEDDDDDDDMHGIGALLPGGDSITVGDDTMHRNTDAGAAVAVTSAAGGVHGVGGGGGGVSQRHGEAPGEGKQRKGQKRKASSFTDPDAMSRASRKKLLEAKMREEYEKQGFRGSIPFQSWRRGLSSEMCDTFAEAVERDLADGTSTLAAT